MAKSNAVARVKAATNPFKGDKTLAAMKRRWSNMTPAQRKANVETFRTAAKGKPKGSAPKPAATKPAKKPPVVKTSTASKPPKKTETPVTKKEEKAVTQHRGGERSRSTGKKPTTQTKRNKPLTYAERVRNRRSSSTPAQRAARKKQLEQRAKDRAARRAARVEASKNSTFKSSYRRAEDARKKK